MRSPSYRVHVQIESSSHPFVITGSRILPQVGMGLSILFSENYAFLILFLALLLIGHDPIPDPLVILLVSTILPRLQVGSKSPLGPLGWNSCWPEKVNSFRAAPRLQTISSPILSFNFLLQVFALLFPGWRSTSLPRKDKSVIGVEEYCLPVSISLSVPVLNSQWRHFCYR